MLSTSSAVDRFVWIVTQEKSSVSVAVFIVFLMQMSRPIGEVIETAIFYSTVNFANLLFNQNRASKCAFV